MANLYEIHSRLQEIQQRNGHRREIQVILDEMLEEIRRITILNFKGGVGKTTIAVNFADYLAERIARLTNGTRGEAVWGFDLDLQCNYTSNFVRPLPAKSLVDVFYEKASLADIAIRLTDNFWLFPGGLAMGNAATYLRSQDGGVKRLFQGICQLLINGGLPDSKGNLVLPRYMLFDTASDNGATTSGFLAANELITPIEYKYFSMFGIVTMIESIGKQMEALDHEVEVKGIIPNQVNELRANTAKYYRSLRKNGDLGNLIYPAIHVDVQFDNAQAEMKSIFKKAPRSRGAKEMERVIQCYLGEYSLDQYLKELDREAAEEELV